MLAYWLIFAPIAWMALVEGRADFRKVHQPGDITRQKWVWSIAFIALSILIGLRHEVGADWFAYVRYVDRAYDAPFSEVIFSTDPAYGFLNWVAANFFGDIYLVNTISAIIFLYGLFTFCRLLPRPWLALLVAVPYLIIVVGMNYTRQSVALGLAMLGLTALINGRTLRFFLWITAASAFHKSAVILAPIVLFSEAEKRVLRVIGAVIIGSSLYVLFLQDSIDSLWYNYMERHYSASGAGVRVAMNAVPALLFLLMRRYFPLQRVQKSFWTWISIIGVSLVVLLYFSYSSAAIDRMALYFSIVQLFVFSMLPDIFGGARSGSYFWVLFLIAYCGVVLFVWLNYADNAIYWLPYKSILFM